MVLFLYHIPRLNYTLEISLMHCAENAMKRFIFLSIERLMLLKECISLRPS